MQYGVSVMAVETREKTTMTVITETVKHICGLRHYQIGIDAHYTVICMHWHWLENMNKLNFMISIWLINFGIFPVNVALECVECVENAVWSYTYTHTGKVHTDAYYGILLRMNVSKCFLYVDSHGNRLKRFIIAKAVKCY